MSSLQFAAAQPQTTVRQDAALERGVELVFDELQKSAPVAASICAKKVAACCCTKRYSVDCSRR